ncbi:MAG: hypothetical protein LBU18_05435 [Treponema sp.]|nr:hypothetical protein [Treponema sp.]
MFNLKWSVLLAILGFVLSLLLSLLSGAGIISFIRALSFGAVFFALSSLLYWMIKRFLPDLLNPAGGDAQGLGSLVDISLGGDDTSPLTAEFQKETGDGFLDEAPDGALGIEGLERLEKDAGSATSGLGAGDSFDAAALDQDKKTGYTNSGTLGEKTPADDFDLFFSPSPGGGSGGPLQMKPAAPISAAFPVDGGDDLDTLPGAEIMSQAFTPSFIESIGDAIVSKEDGGSPVSVAFPGIERNSAVSKEDGGEFRGKEKESALAIQTILKRN